MPPPPFFYIELGCSSCIHFDRTNYGVRFSKFYMFPCFQISGLQIIFLSIQDLKSVTEIDALLYHCSHINVNVIIMVPVLKIVIDSSLTKILINCCYFIIETGSACSSKLLKNASWYFFNIPFK